MSGLIKIFEFCTEASTSKSLNNGNFKAFFLRSTASTVIEVQGEQCVEDSGIARYFIPSGIDKESPSEQIRLIVADIINKANGDLGKVSILFKIHGYNTSEASFCDDCYSTAHEIKEMHGNDDRILVFFGYRWPSELISMDGLISTLSRSVLPLWLQILGTIGLIRIFIDIYLLLPKQALVNNLLSHSDIILHTMARGIVCLEGIFKHLDIRLVLGEYAKNFDQWPGGVFVPVILLIFFRLISFFVPAILMLMGLRASGYLQDIYRATNYGVPDLIQFFRVFDYWIRQDSRFKNITATNERRIHLSFVSHSMGAFVTTNLIRILSDVFGDSNAAHTLSVINQGNKSNISPNSHIGRFFTLDKMVLVSPDIPVNTILSERSNFLGSSLMRFRESYLFSNQADMVLRLFSTVVNYLSFPSRTPQMGYRLGNLGIEYKDFDYKKMRWINRFFTRLRMVISQSPVNYNKYAEEKFDLVDVKQYSANPTGTSILNYLVIGVQYQKLQSTKTSKPPFLAQKFTYFDCTDYLRRNLNSQKNQFKDGKFKKNKSQDKAFEVLDLIDYILLLPKISFTHGGYFKCQVTREAIYRIASRGYDEFANTPNGIKILRGDYEIKVLRPK